VRWKPDRISAYHNIVLRIPVCHRAATADDFPSYLSKRDGKVDEELRVFYVAASRAKRRLLFSHFQVNDRGYMQQPSRFLTCLSAPEVSPPNRFAEEMERRLARK